MEKSNTLPDFHEYAFKDDARARHSAALDFHAFSNDRWRHRRLSDSSRKRRLHAECRC